jgi:hypothetical protein
MAKRSLESKVVETNEIPPDVIGAVVMADLAQIEADAKTHQDSFARDRILKAVNRLREIAKGDVSELEEVSLT